MNDIQLFADLVESPAREPRPISAIMIEVLARHGLRELTHVRLTGSPQVRERRHALDIRKANPLISAPTRVTRSLTA
jgi:hypothetical protein